MRHRQDIEVEEDDIPVGRKTDKGFLGLGVLLAEAVGAGQDGHDCGPGGFGAEDPELDEPHGRQKGIGQVVDEIIQPGAVEPGQDGLDVAASGHGPICGVDDDRQPEGGQEHLNVFVHQGQGSDKSQNDPDAGVRMDPDRTELFPVHSSSTSVTLMCGKGTVCRPG